MPIPVSKLSEVGVCRLSLAGIAGSHPAGGWGCLYLVSIVCCQVEVSATGRFLDQRNPSDCGVSE